MALKHGRNARIYFTGTDLSSYLHSADLTVDVDNADSTTFVNSGWRSNLAGQAGSTMSFEGYHDVALDGVLHAVLGVDNGVLTVCPGGASAIGDLARMVYVTATALSEAPSIDAVSPFSWAVASQAQVAFGQVLHVMGEDTNTTTGATKDDSAATTDGWMAHLHAASADAGSWVVKLEDSANGSDWLDVSGGAFTAVTGAIGHQLRSAAGATLRRYVRYTATRTGGAGGDGITFFLAYSRYRVD
jgi:hypothetical protein